MNFTDDVSRNSFDHRRMKLDDPCAPVELYYLMSRRLICPG
jgi:hypothetical protein